MVPVLWWLQVFSKPAENCRQQLARTARTLSPVTSNTPAETHCLRDALGPQTEGQHEHRAART